MCWVFFWVENLIEDLHKTAQSCDGGGGAFYAVSLCVGRQKAQHNQALHSCTPPHHCALRTSRGAWRTSSMLTACTLSKFIVPKPRPCVSSDWSRIAIFQWATSLEIFCCLLALIVRLCPDLFMTFSRGPNIFIASVPSWLWIWSSTAAKIARQCPPTLLHRKGAACGHLPLSRITQRRQKGVGCHTSGIFDTESQPLCVSGTSESHENSRTPKRMIWRLCWVVYTNMIGTKIRYLCWLFLNYFQIIVCTDIIF